MAVTAIVFPSDSRLARLHRLPVLRRSRRDAGRGGAARRPGTRSRSSTPSRCRARRLTPLDEGDVRLGAPIEAVLAARAGEARRRGRRLHAVPPAARARPAARRAARARCAPRTRARRSCSRISTRAGSTWSTRRSGRRARRLPRGRRLPPLRGRGRARRRCVDELRRERPPRGPVRGRPAASPSPLDALPLPAWDLVDLPAYFAFHERVVARLGRPSWAFPIDRPSAPAAHQPRLPVPLRPLLVEPLLAQRRRARRAQDAAPLLARVPRSPARRSRARAACGGCTCSTSWCNVNEAPLRRGARAARQARPRASRSRTAMRADYVLAAAPRDDEAAAHHAVSVSAESGVQRVVDEIVDKQLDLAAIRSVAERAQAAGVPLLVHFMIGLPGETRRRSTARSSSPSTCTSAPAPGPSVQFATPLPGHAPRRDGQRAGRASCRSSPTAARASSKSPRSRRAVTLEELRALQVDLRPAPHGRRRARRRSS